MKILVTGGAGFIGSHTVKLLLQQNHQVVVYDISKQNLDRLEKHDSLLTIEGDIKDSELLKKSLQGVDAVIHMASLIEVSESVKNPLKFTDTNVMGLVTLLEAMKDSGVKKIVFSSSACVYGTPKDLPIKEDAAIAPDNPYGATKVSSEAYLNVYHKLYNFDTIILRYFNPYGPGELHQPESHAIPNFIKAALEKTPIPLYWNGSQVRDFIYVEDLAQAHIAPLNLSGMQIFNIGTEKGVKIIDVVNKLSDILGYKLEVKDLGERPGDVAQSYASSQKLKQATNWEPKVTLEEGLIKTVEFFKNNP